MFDFQLVYYTGASCRYQKIDIGPAYGVEIKLIKKLFIPKLCIHRIRCRYNRYNIR